MAPAGPVSAGPFLICEKYIDPTVTILPTLRAESTEHADLGPSGRCRRVDQMAALGRSTAENLRRAARTQMGGDQIFWGALRMSLRAESCPCRDREATVKR